MKMMKKPKYINLFIDCADEFGMISDLQAGRLDAAIKGFEHVDLGGNCVFFENDSEEEYTRVIALAKKNIAAMKKSAEEKGMKAFSYRETAKRAIGQNA